VLGGIGLALVVLAAAAWLVGFVVVGDRAGDTSREASAVRNRFEAELEVSGEVEVDLSAGRHLVYVVVPEGVGDPAAASRGLTATVTAGDGAEVGPAGPDTSFASASVYRSTGTDFDLELVSEVVVPTDGTYTVEVDGVPVEGVERAGIVEAVDLHADGEELVAGVLLYLVGLALGGLGVLLALVAAIWFLVARTAR
jgi:hypothetical protein